jgi:hypothetical protein
MTLKANDIPNIQYKVPSTNLETIFNVYENDDDNQKYFYNILKTVNIPKDLNPDFYDFYTVKFGDVWPNIAWTFYGNVNLWWLICVTNQIQNPTSFPKPGLIIKIIKTPYITEILNRISE